jgi:hypothetical protein
LLLLPPLQAIVISPRLLPVDDIVACKSAASWEMVFTDPQKALVRFIRMLVFLFIISHPQDQRFRLPIRLHLRRWSLWPPALRSFAHANDTHREFIWLVRLPPQRCSSRFRPYVRCALSAQENMLIDSFLIGQLLAITVNRPLRHMIAVGASLCAGD